jgi:hypothetical protein
MKMMRFGILVILILIGINSKNTKVHARGFTEREIVYRPVTLTVLDAETELPLEGITVTVVNIIGYCKYVLFDFKTDSFCYIYEYRTNEQGVVEIPQFNYNFNRHHYIQSQRIGLNIELINKNESAKEQERWFEFGIFYDNAIFFRPQPEFKAGQIVYNTYSHDWKQSEQSKPSSTFVYKEYAITGYREDQTRFPSDHEEFTFFLERFIEPEESTNSNLLGKQFVEQGNNLKRLKIV